MYAPLSTKKHSEISRLIVLKYLFGVMVIFFPFSVFASISNDASAKVSQTSTTALTYNITIGSGSDEILFVCVQGSTNASDVTGATVGGSAMTLIGDMRYSSGRYAYLFYKTGVASGVQTIVVTAASSIAMGSGASSYFGASQTSQPDAFASSTASASSITTSLTTIADNSWLIGCDANDGGSPSVSGGYTMLQSDGSGWGFADSNGAITPAGSASMTFTLGGSTHFVTLLASFSPSSGGGGGGGATTTTATSTDYTTLGDVVFGEAVIIVLLFLMFVAFIANRITPRKPWNK